MTNCAEVVVVASTFDVTVADSDGEEHAAILTAIASIPTHVVAVRAIKVVSDRNNKSSS